MRVLFWSELFWPYIGGVEVLSARLIPELVRRGHEVVVVTSQDNLDLPEQEQLDGISIRRLQFRRALTSGSIEQVVSIRRQIADLKRSLQPDLIHVNSVGPSSLFHLQTRSAWPAPVVVTMQQNILDDEDTSLSSIMGRMLRSADWTTCVSAELLRQVRTRVPETRQRSSLIYNVLELPGLGPAPLPFDEPRLLCLGRLVPAKGFDVALRAWANICARYPRAKLVVAGDGDARCDLEQLAADLNLGAAVEFLGWVDPGDVPAILNTATAVLMPSRREGLPLVAVQAAMMGRPIIAARTTGLTEVVLHGETGALVEQEDASAVAVAVARILNHPDESRRQGAAARRRAIEMFDWDSTVDAYSNLYYQLNQEANDGSVAQRAS